MLRRTGVNARAMGGAALITDTRDTTLYIPAAAVAVVAVIGHRRDPPVGEHHSVVSTAHGALVQASWSVQAVVQHTRYVRLQSQHASVPHGTCPLTLLLLTLFLWFCRCGGARSARARRWSAQAG
jgi:hypothetical protein